MKRAVVIGAEDTEAAIPWVAELERSLRRCRYEVTIRTTDRGPLDALAWASWRFDAFAYLPMRSLVKDVGPLEQAFDEEMAVSFADKPHAFGHFAGKYLSKPWVKVFRPVDKEPKLGDAPPPPPTDLDWLKAYLEATPYAQLGHLGAPGSFEPRHEEMVSRSENEWLVIFSPALQVQEGHRLTLVAPN